MWCNTWNRDKVTCFFFLVLNSFYLFFLPHTFVQLHIYTLLHELKHRVTYLHTFIHVYKQSYMYTYKHVHNQSYIQSKIIIILYIQSHPMM